MFKSLRRPAQSPVNMPVEQQLRTLPGSAGKVGGGLALAAGLLAATLLTLGIFGVYERTPLLVFGGVVAFFTWVLWSGKRGMERAWRAYQQGGPRTVQTRIETDQGDSRVFYHGRLELDGARWRLLFYNPVGWTPEAGELETRVYCDPDTGAPALLLAEKGILISERIEREPEDAAR